MDYRNCPVAKYHDFQVITGPYMLSNVSPIQVEVCRRCKKREEYSFKTDGKMVDEHKYFLDHIRAFAQPAGGPEMAAVYYDVNPDMLLKFEKEEKDKKVMADRHGELGEKFRFALGRALQDKDDGMKKK
jgi:hypothetical protein